MSTPEDYQVSRSDKHNTADTDARAAVTVRARNVCSAEVMSENIRRRTVACRANLRRGIGWKHMDIEPLPAARLRHCDSRPCCGAFPAGVEQRRRAYYIREDARWDRHERSPGAGALIEGGSKGGCAPLASLGSCHLVLEHVP
jgi:hypothetical protein